MAKQKKTSSRTTQRGARIRATGGLASGAVERKKPAVPSKRSAALTVAKAGWVEVRPIETRLRGRSLQDVIGRCESRSKGKPGEPLSG